MKDYYDRNYRIAKSQSYLYSGLIMAALTLIMIIVSALGIVNGSDIVLVVTGFAAAVFWLIAAAVCLRVYYKDNHVEIKEKARVIAETVENAVKK